MPSVSKKQRRFMAAAAHSRSFARKAGVPQSVAREYHEADKRAGESNRGASEKFVGSHAKRKAVIEKIVARRRRAGM